MLFRSLTWTLRIAGHVIYDSPFRARTLHVHNALMIRYQYTTDSIVIQMLVTRRLIRYEDEVSPMMTFLRTLMTRMDARRVLGRCPLVCRARE